MHISLNIFGCDRKENILHETVTKKRPHVSYSDETFFFLFAEGKNFTLKFNLEKHIKAPKNPQNDCNPCTLKIND